MERGRYTDTHLLHIDMTMVQARVSTSTPLFLLDIRGGYKGENIRGRILGEDIRGGY